MTADGAPGTVDCRRLKALLVGSKFPPEYAGAGLRIHNTYKRLAQSCDPLVWSAITASTEFSGTATYRYDDIVVERISSAFLAGWRDVAAPVDKLLHAVRSWLEALKLWRNLRQRDFDYLHVFGSTAVTAMAIAYAAAKRRPVVIELVTTEASPTQTLPGIRIRGWLQRHLRRHCLIVAISAKLGERCDAEGFHRNTWVRPNPVDTQRFFPTFSERNELRASYTPFGPNDQVLCMVAKFMPQKNQIFLLDVLSLLPERVKLVLAGPLVSDGPLHERDHAYMAALRSGVIARGLSSRVHVVPDFVQADSYMKLADVYMLPNRQEGLGTPMLESLACGIPVVANADEPAFRQWVDEGRNGFTRPLDPSAWAAAVDLALRLPAEALHDSARAIAEAASAERIDRQFLHLVRMLVALPPTAELDVAAALRSCP